MQPPDNEQAQRTEAEVNAEDPIAGRPAAPPDSESVEQGYEVHDVRVGPIVKALIGLVVLSAVAFAITTAFQVLRTGTIGDFTPPATGVANAPLNPVPTVIQSRAATGVESRQLREEELEMLNSYGVVDEGAGVYRIPVERAMELLVERGLPARPEGEVEDFNQLPLDSSSGRMMERTSP